jgi:hypothetical protein
MRHAPPKELPLGSRISALVFQAIRHLGRSAVDSEAIARLRRSLSPEQKGELLRDARYTTDWIADLVRQVASEEPEIVAHG